MGHCRQSTSGTLGLGNDAFQDLPVRREVSFYNLLFIVSSLKTPNMCLSEDTLLCMRLPRCHCGRLDAQQSSTLNCVIDCCLPGEHPSNITKRNRKENLEKHKVEIKIVMAGNWSRFPLLHKSENRSCKYIMLQIFLMFPVRAWTWLWSSWQTSITACNSLQQSEIKWLYKQCNDDIQ